MGIALMNAVKAPSLDVGDFLPVARVVRLPFFQSEVQPGRCSRKRLGTDKREKAVLVLPGFIELIDECEIPIVIPGNEPAMLAIERRRSERLLLRRARAEPQFGRQQFAAFRRTPPDQLGTLQLEPGHVDRIGRRKSAQDLGYPRAMRIIIPVPDLHARQHENGPIRELLFGRVVAPDQEPDTDRRNQYERGDFSFHVGVPSQTRHPRSTAILAVRFAHSRLPDSLKLDGVSMH